jgi:hypothetical protein
MYRVDRYLRHDISIPNDAASRVALCRLLWDARRDDPEHEPPSWHERLLWIETWSVWPSAEHMPLFTRLRAAFGEHRGLMEAPGHLVTSSDDDDGL